MAYVARISWDTEKISCYNGKDVSRSFYIPLPSNVAFFRMKYGILRKFFQVENTLAMKLPFPLLDRAAYNSIYLHSTTTRVFKSITGQSGKPQK